MRRKLPLLNSALPTGTRPNYYLGVIFSVARAKPRLEPSSLKIHKRCDGECHYGLEKSPTQVKQNRRGGGEWLVWVKL